MIYPLSSPRMSGVGCRPVQFGKDIKQRVSDGVGLAAVTAGAAAGHEQIEKVPLVNTAIEAAQNGGPVTQFLALAVAALGAYIIIK